MRKAKDLREDYNKPFPTRLRELMDEMPEEKKQLTLANAVGVTRQTISAYTNGTACPTYDKLLEISNYFNVSCDYLVGKSDVKTMDISIQEIHRKTSLSEKAISLLLLYKEQDEQKEIDDKTIPWIDSILAGDEYSFSLLEMIELFKFYEMVSNNYALYIDLKTKYRKKFDLLNEQRSKGYMTQEEYYTAIDAIYDDPETKKLQELDRDDCVKYKLKEPTKIKISPDIAKQVYSQEIQESFMSLLDGIIISRADKITQNIYIGGVLGLSIRQREELMKYGYDNTEKE